MQAKWAAAVAPLSGERTPTCTEDTGVWLRDLRKCIEKLDGDAEVLATADVAAEWFHHVQDARYAVKDDAGRLWLSEQHSAGADVLLLSLGKLTCPARSPAQAVRVSCLTAPGSHSPESGAASASSSSARRSISGEP
jgi:hypothetical protein